MNDAEKRIVVLGLDFVAAWDGLQRAERAWQYYDHNADPTGDIQKRLEQEIVNATDYFAKAMNRLGGVT